MMRGGVHGKLGAGIRHHVALAPFTTIRIGGAAEYFLCAGTVDELLAGIEWAEQQNLPIAVMGGGSNLLVADAGVKGLVIKCELQGFEMSGSMLWVESGVMLAAAAKQSTNAGWSGLECGIGIPGTIGGAVVGNASNFLGSVSDRLVSVEVVDRRTGDRKTLTKEACEFAYRQSRFKHSGEIILSATFELQSADPAILRASMTRLLEYKAATQKTPYPTSGCMFKNPKILSENDRSNATADGIDDLIRFSDDMGCDMLPFRQLLERAGLKGRRMGGLMISDVNANFMLNVGGATAADTLEMIELIRQILREKFHLELELEIQMLGFNS